MDTPFFCPECAAEHAEPADASLGHMIVCLSCAVGLPSRPLFPLEITLVDAREAA